MIYKIREAVPEDVPEVGSMSTKDSCLIALLMVDCTDCDEGVLPELHVEAFDISEANSS